MLLAVDLYEDFINVESVAEASVFSLQSAGINGSEFYTPEADRFSADSDASFSQEVFNVPVAQIEAVVEPDCVADDVWWKSMAFVGIHVPILAISESLLGSTSPRIPPDPPGNG